MTSLKQIREQYPQYDDISDHQLVNTLHERHYSDIPKDEFYQRLNYEPPRKQGMLESAKNSWMDALTSGTFDNAAGVVLAVPDAGIRYMTGQDEEFSPAKSYRRIRKEVAGDVEQAYEQNPVSAMVGAVGGGAMLGAKAGQAGKAILGSKAGTSITSSLVKNPIIGATIRNPLPMTRTAARIGGAGTVGAMYGGSYRAGSADEGSLKDRVKAGYEGTKDGGLIGIALETAARGGGKVYKTFRNRGRVPKGVADAAARRAQDASDLGIDLSRGQATRDFKTQVFENDALTGGRGKYAQRMLEGQRAKQLQQVDDTLGQIQDSMSPSKIDDPFDAALNVQNAIKTRVGKLKKGSGKYYDKVKDSGAKIDVSATKNLSDRILKAADDANGVVGTEIADHLPASKTIFAKIKKLPKRTPDGAASVGVMEIELLRRSISKSKGTNPEDGRVIRAIGREFDNWMYDSISNALKSGDPGVISDLKKARTLASKYLVMTKNPQKIIRKMADDSADSVEIANWLFGTSQLGGRQTSAAAVREIKKFVGKDSPAMNDLRRAAFTKLIKDVRLDQSKGVQRLAGDIQQFATGNGRDLARELYGSAAQKEFTKLARVLRNLKPDEITTNSSRTAQTGMRRISDWMKTAFPLLGLAVGDVTGMMVGFGASTGMGAANRFAVKKAVNSVVPKVAREIGEATAGSAIIAPAAQQATRFSPQ